MGNFQQKHYIFFIFCRSIFEWELFWDFQVVYMYSMFVAVPIYTTAYACPAVCVI